MNYRNTEIEKNGELFLMKAIADYYKKTDNPLTLVDVGANIGNYSRQLARHFANNAVIYAFEPFSIPFEKLKALQQDIPSLRAYRIGLSDKPEELLIHSSEEYSEIGGIYNRSFIFQDIPHDKQELNRFTTLDSFCAENNITHVHLLKIDVEGHELPVLKGAANLLQRSGIDFIQFEFGAGNHFSRTYFLDFFNLLDKNYSFYRLLTDGLLEISVYNSELEMQVLTNFVAISRNILPNSIPKIHVR